VILKASEKQIIISVRNLLARNEATSLENLESYGTMFFCSYKKDWNISEYIADTCHCNVVGIDVIVKSKLAKEEKLSRYLYIINK